MEFTCATQCMTASFCHCAVITFFHSFYSACPTSLLPVFNSYVHHICIYLLILVPIINYYCFYCDFNTCFDYFSDSKWSKEYSILAASIQFTYNSFIWQASANIKFIDKVAWFFSFTQPARLSILTHLRPSNLASFYHNLGFRTKKCRLPQDQIS